MPRTFTGVCSGLLLLVFSAAAAGTAAPSLADGVIKGAEVSAAAKGDHLPSLRGAMGLTEGPSAEHRVRPLKVIPLVDGPGFATDTVRQTSPRTTSATAVSGKGFDGLGKNAYGFTVQYAPPDTTGAVGKTQYVQWVNASFIVFDKSGAQVLGPLPGNKLWENMNTPCATSNDGDPIVQYDKLANRWVMSQFAVPGGTQGYWECVAVSDTYDFTGAWTRYAFNYASFPDYPKVGVWPDGYYVTFNMFGTTSFKGPMVCAYERDKMLAGQDARQQCFQLSTTYASLLPADLDGTTPPPAGAPNYLLSKMSTSLGYWKFHVDWANTANTTLTGPSLITVAGFNAACKGGTCVPQPGTGQKLDSLGDRLMYRLAYRNLNGVETMLVNHSVTAGTTNSNPYTGVRWYELRGMNAGAAAKPTVYQQGTFSPDTKYRWMGSIAMDKAGNIAVGYSKSSSSLYPSIAYATRAPGDTLGTLGSETTIQAGAGSQLSNLSRWGDYTQMSVDPVDDCTFWYTGEYLKSSGTFNWSTRIASFKLNGCL